MKSLNKFFFWILTVGSLLTARGADLNYAIVSLQITNNTGYVIDADALSVDPSYNREDLLVQSRVATTNTSAAGSLVEYQLRYRLLDGAGQPHPIYDEHGQVNPSYTYNLTNGFFSPAASTLFQANLAALRPAERLDPEDRYTVELRLFSSGGIKPLDTSTNGPHTFYHFTNLVSNDPGFNVIATADNITFSRAYAVATDPDKDSFLAEIDFTLRRYDNFLGNADPFEAVPISLHYQLINAVTEEVIPLASNQTNITRFLFKYDPPPPSNPIVPWVLSGSHTVQVRPAPGVQLDSVNDQYRLVVTISHQEISGDPASSQTGTTLPGKITRLLHFNGTLRFGALDTTFGSIANNPTALTVVAGSHINSVLAVDSQSGSVPSIPGATYGDGSNLNVRLLPDGDAEIDGDMAALNLPPGITVDVNNVRVVLVGPTFLTPDGLISGLRVYLPTGTGYRTDTLGHILRRSFLVTGVALGSDFHPLSDVTFAPSAPIYVVEETKPLWLETSSILWRVNEGSFDFNVNGTGVQHVRSDEYANLSAVAAILENSDRALKRSNDRYLDSVQTVASPVTVQADVEGIGRLSLNLTLGPGDYRAHFPYDARIQWTGSGAWEVLDDQVVSDSSQLDGAGEVSVGYGTGCSGVDCGPDATVNTVSLLPDGGVLRFTRDGGLVGAGNLTAPHRLQWGYIPSLDDFAHEAFTFDAGTFHMPGLFLRGDQTSLSFVHRPGALLYTGVAATNTAYLERPDMPGTLNQQQYETGFADYAGLNFAVGQDGVRQAESVLAGTSTGNYQLKGISKYYARRGGVSGLHDSVPDTFPSTLTLYGYEFNFDNYGLNFLDNRMQDSFIHGYINIPYPSGFQQEFASLIINCLGGIEGDAMPAFSPDKNLTYWNGKFDALNWRFRHDPEELCNVTNAFLVMGVQTSIAHVPETLYGTLGFLPNGNLIPRAVGPEDIDSRLKLPNVIHVAGPETEEYILVPVLDVYFNNHDEISETNAPVGWVNLVGTMDVPFFEDLQVHAHTSANKDSENAPIYMMGGWPDHGWESAPGNNFFTAAYFDDSNRGYASGITPDEYRNNDGEAYHPRAHRTWLKIIPFDYPMNWSSVTRSFRSQQPKVHKLMVLSTENELKYLSAKNAEITFGAQFDGLPQLNLANLAFEALDAVTGFSDELSNYLIETLQGSDLMNQLLSADLHPYFSQVFDQQLQPKIEAIYAGLVDDYNLDAPNWKDLAGTRINAAFQLDADSIASRLQKLVGDTPMDPGLMQRLDGYLFEAQDALTNITQILQEDMEGNRHVAGELMQLLVQNMAAQFAAGFVDEIVQPLLAEADPTLDEITLTLQNLNEALGLIRQNLAIPSGMGNELKQLFQAHAVEINAAIPNMMNGIGAFVQDIDLNLDSPIDDYAPEEITQLIRQEIEDEFYGTELAAAVQVIHKQRLYDVDAAMRQAVDTLFQELNNVIRSVIAETAEELNNQFTEFSDALEGIAAAAKINGYAHINGDSLKEARVDLHASLDLGSALEFNGYLQIKELDSMGSPGCDYGGEDSITEVSLGAEDVQVGWISPELRASVGTKFTFSEVGDGFPLRGMGGSFELTGKLDYEAFAINFLGAAVAFGQEENYLSAAAGMRVNKYEVFGGIYFGRSCSLDPIRLWDPDAAGLLGTPPFTGIYGYGEGWIPINELIGIPASCLFNISAGLGVGAGVFLEGPTFLAKMTAGVSGEALCLVAIKGQLVGTGVLEGLDANVVDGLSVKAKGTVGGEVGFCPFCLKVEQSVALTFKQGKWKLDF